MKNKGTLEEAMEKNGYHDKPSDDLWREGVEFGANWQKEQMYSEEELINAMNWMMTQYFEFYECPATGRVNHYIQTIKQHEQ